MKKLMTIAAAFMICATTLYASDLQTWPAVKAKSDTTKTKKASSLYTCPMHADVTSDKPGKCPKCGMALEKKEKGKKSSSCKMK